jgi:hypothetical protein
MKKMICSAVCVVAVSLVLIGASDASKWEGAASVDAAGDLPDKGYYVATNSLPRNTVVEITNLATGKSIQAMVAAGLDNPGGLLTVLSPDVAKAIGLQAKSIGRVSMIQTKDLLAISPSSTRGINPTGESGDGPDADTPLTEPAAGTPSRDNGRLPEPDGAWEGGGYVYNDDTVLEPIPGRELAYASSPAARPAEPDALGAMPEPRPRQAAPEGPFPLDGLDIALVPGEEQPPEEMVWSLPHEREIPPLPDVPHGDSGAFMGDEVLGIDPSQIIAAIDESAGDAPFDTSFEPALIIAAVPPAEKPQVDEGTPGLIQEFSVPMISSLETGMYYLQLGAYRKPESVESELKRIGKSYPSYLLTIQPGGNPERPLYRILFGPLNHGESGALLQRFRGSGWADAYIRQGS